MQQIPDAAVRALEALKKAEMFIENGVEYGFIRLPEKPDPALDTLPQVKAAIEALTNEGTKPVDVAAVQSSALIELLHDMRFRLENMGSTDETDADVIERIINHVDHLRALSAAPTSEASNDKG